MRFKYIGFFFFCCVLLSQPCVEIVSDSVYIWSTVIKDTSQNRIFHYYDDLPNCNVTGFVDKDTSAKYNRIIKIYTGNKIIYKKPNNKILNICNENSIKHINIDGLSLIKIELSSSNLLAIRLVKSKIDSISFTKIRTQDFDILKVKNQKLTSNSCCYSNYFDVSQCTLEFASFFMDTFENRVLVRDNNVLSYDKNTSDYLSSISISNCNFKSYLFFRQNSLYFDLFFNYTTFLKGLSFQNDSLFGKIIMNDCTINNGSADFYSINYMKEDGPYFNFANNSYEKIKIPFKKLADKSSSYVIDFDSSLSWNQIESEYAQIINSLKEQGLWSDHDAALLEYKSRQRTHYLSDHKYVKWIISNFINITSQYGTNYFRALTSVMFVIIIFGLGYFLQSMNYHREKPNWWFWSYKKPGILSLLFSSYLYSIAVLFGHYPSRLLGIKKRKLCPLAVVELAIGYILISIFLVTLFNVTTR